MRVMIKGNLQLLELEPVWMAVAYKGKLNEQVRKHNIIMQCIIVTVYIPNDKRKMVCSIRVSMYVVYL